MAVYKSTSIKEVIGRVIRISRTTDLTYADDIIEWIGEGIGRMLVRWKLKRYFQTLDIKDNMSKLPCGLQSLNGVFYKGHRLRVGTGSVDARVQPVANLILGTDPNNSQTYFKASTDPKLIANEQELAYIRGSDIVPIKSQSIQDFYQLELDYIKTSFETGSIDIYYRRIDVDEEGYPLIPDLEEAKLALQWYVLGNMCMTGYKLADPRMDYEFCEERANRYFNRAKNMIKTPSEDELESAKNLLVNLIPPSNYYETFFIGGEQRKFVLK